MRVTHIINSTHLLGVERHLILLLDALQTQGVEVALIVLAAPGAEPPLLVLARRRNIPAQALDAPRYPAPAVIKRLAACLHQRPPDVVHIHGGEAATYGVLAAQQAGIQRVVCSSYGTGWPRERGPAGWLRGRLWSRLDRLIAASQRVADEALTHGIPPGKVALIPWGVSAEACGVGKGARDVLCAELGIDPEAALIGMLCALDELPGPDQAIKAVWHLSARRKNAHLLIVGEGAQRPALERLARGYCIADRVHFLGWREDAHAVIAALDILLLTCQTSDAPLLLLEAAALKTSVIAAAFDGVAELIIEGETGLLVGHSDGLDHLTSGLWLLLDDPAIRQHMGQQAHAALASHNTFEPEVRGTLDVYASVLA